MLVLRGLFSLVYAQGEKSRGWLVDDKTLFVFFV